MQRTAEAAGALAGLLREPLVVGVGLLVALRVSDPRRFPRNAVALALAWAAALGAGALLGPWVAPEAPPASVAFAAAAAGLAYAFRGPARGPFRLAAGALAAASVASAPDAAAGVAGLVLGSAVAVGVLRSLESFHALGPPRPLPAPQRRRADSAPRILVVAGEASADRWGSRVLAELRAREPALEASGVGGPRLRAEGLRSEPHADLLAIVGFTGVVAALPGLVSLYRRLVARLDRERPDVLVAIDLPDWNALLALQARARGIPTLFFVAPQVWAWRPRRVERLADRISRLVVLFPFEAEAWRREGVSVACHGHPLAEELSGRRETRAQARARLGLDPTRPILALAPGSRPAEIARHMGPLLDAAARLRDAVPDLAFALPVASEAYDAPLRAAAAAAGVDVRLVRDGAFELFLAADFGLVCSGTATLEAAFAGLPMAIFYRGSRLNAAVARRLVRIDRIGLPNLLLGGPIPAFPELFQEQVTGERLAETALAAMRDPQRLATLRDACARVRALVPPQPTAAAVAEEILALARGDAPRLSVEQKSRSRPDA